MRILDHVPRRRTGYPRPGPIGPACDTLAIQKRSSRSSTSPRIIAEARYFSMPSTDPADNGHGDPFPDRPPQYVRALLYEYRFADPGTYVRTGQWWVRRLEGLYFPRVSLADFPQVAPPETGPLPGIGGNR